MRDGCPFCGYEGPSPILYEGTAGVPPDFAFPYYVIEPLSPVTPGHLLVIPRAHCPDFRHHPRLLGAMMAVAADFAGTVDGSHVEDCNLIVSAGRAATQTVMHMHVHIVPRREGDGLPLPWTTQ